MKYRLFALIVITPFSMKSMQALQHEEFLASIIQTFEQTKLFEQTIQVILRSNLQHDDSFLDLVLIQKEKIFARAKAIIGWGKFSTQREIANAKAGLMLINFAGLNNLEIRKSAQDVYMKLEELNEQITRGPSKTN